ncbi:MAG: hypothetical protein ACI3XR_03505 [Eubacteriales bacterium]
MMKRNAKLLSVCSLLLAAVLSVGILAGCDSSDHNTDDDEDDDDKERQTTTAMTENPVITTDPPAVTTDKPAVTTADTTGIPSGTVTTPDTANMKVAASESDKYTFRIPESWTVVGTDPLMAVAEDGLTNVSLSITVDPNHQFESAYSYAGTVKIALEQTYETVTVASPVKTRLDGEYAASISISLTEQGVSMKIDQVCCIKNSHIYLLTFSALADSYAAQRPQFDRILAAFTFDTEPITYPDTCPGETYPDTYPGDSDMKVAGSKSGVYTFFVPESWTVTSTDPLTAVAEDGITNVNLNFAEIQDGSPTVIEYAEQFKSALEQIYPTATITAPAQASLDGEDAATLCLVIVEQGISVRIDQYYCIKDGIAYVFTFTTLTDYYVEQSTRFDRILECFTFG